MFLINMAIILLIHQRLERKYVLHFPKCMIVIIFDRTESCLRDFLKKSRKNHLKILKILKLK